MNAVAKISRAAEACVLVDDPDRGLSCVLALSPGDYGFVEVLDLGTKIAEAYGNDLGDL